MLIQPIIKRIITIIVVLLMQSCVSGIVSTSPKEAAIDFLEGFSQQHKPIMEKHMDNSYINFVCNIQGDKAVVERMKNALFENFSYKILDIGEKNDVAVAKVSVKNKDFSSVMAGYESASYKYIGDNLYSAEIADKKYLNDKCLEIYVEQIEKAAASGAEKETIVYLPMIDNGYYGWNVAASDELIRAMLGGMELPLETTK